MTRLAIQVSTDDKIEHLQSALKAFPNRISNARARAFREISPWLEREVLKIAVSASGVESQSWKALARFVPHGSKASVGIWLGTKEIAAHHLGNVRWSRNMSGAAAGSEVFPHSWSWEPPRKTAGLIMQRQGESRFPIEVVYWKIHALVLRAVESFAPRINDRYQSVMQRELEREIQELGV